MQSPNKAPPRTEGTEWGGEKYEENSAKIKKNCDKVEEKWRSWNEDLDSFPLLASLHPKWPSTQLLQYAMRVEEQRREKRKRIERQRQRQKDKETQRQ